jgi:hypothetical protein
VRGSMLGIYHIAPRRPYQGKTGHYPKCDSRVRPRDWVPLGRPREHALTWRVSATLANRACHSPFCWHRNNRAVSYQWVRSPSMPQRYSAAAGRQIHTGTPSAPARCATAVSTVITRSNSIIAAAVRLGPGVAQSYSWGTAADLWLVTFPVTNELALAGAGWRCRAPKTLNHAGGRWSASGLGG